MEFLKSVFIFLMLVCSQCPAQTPSCPKILHYIHEELPQQGVLKSSDGFVYVDVDDAYIHKLIAFIQKDGFEKPPYFGSTDLVGAHISVIYQDEMKQYGVGEIEECGETIDFRATGCNIVHPHKWKDMDEVYFVVVEAPELDQIRKKYGLPKREYDFHITIGVKHKAAM